MRTFSNPPKASWPELIRRPQLELEFLESSVRNTFTRVKASGDQALIDLTLQYDGVSLDTTVVSKEEITNAIAGLDQSVKNAIAIAAKNIKAFHEQQQREVLMVETMPGVRCWRKSVPIQKIGIYIPGGTAPLFSTVLMLGIPASIAGCEEIILCTPPNKDGTINNAILFAASLAGITKVFKVGGAQAIAAMAFGTQSIPPVYKIFGPGNQYVTKAKQMISQQGIAIDMPAGPSEVMVIMDQSADPSFVASDLLSQAEHGIDSQVVLISFDEPGILAVQKEIEQQLLTLPRKGLASQALDNSFSVYFSDKETAMEFANEYAPEHLIINTYDCDSLSERVINAGSVFLGQFSPEAVGDYASGTNHTLPTNGHAKAFSGVSLESFSKMITYQKLSKEGLANVGEAVETMARAEQLEAHCQAVSIRLKKIK